MPRCTGAGSKSFNTLITTPSDSASVPSVLQAIVVAAMIARALVG